MKLNNHISQQDLELLDDYLSGNMPKSQQSEFKVRLDTDPALREAQLMITAINEAILTEKLDSFHNSATKKTHSIAPVKKLRTYWMAAAAMIIVIAATAVFFLRGNNDSRLAAEYFEPDPGTPTTMGTTDNYAFDRGMVDYKLGNYNEAIAAWRPLFSAGKPNDTLHYFTGVSFLAMQNADSAAQHLRAVWNDKQSIFHLNAAWYLALALLHQDKITEALSLLEQSNHPKKEELISRIK